MKPPAMRPRPGGGFNPGIGHFNDHMDEQAMQSAMKQKALSQMAGAQTGPASAGGPGQLTNPFASGSAHGGSGLPPGAGVPGGMPGAGFPGLSGADKIGGTDGQATGSPSTFDTLVTQPVEALAKVFLGALHLDKLLGLDGSTDTPEQKAKKQAMHKRYEQLTEEQQAVARQKYQERIQRDKALEQERQQKKQLEEQQKSASFEMPASPQKGPVGPASGKSKKSNAIQKLQQDRKTLGGPQSAG